jgi:hypothetical protein
LVANENREKTQLGTVNLRNSFSGRLAFSLSTLRMLG